MTRPRVLLVALAAVCVLALVVVTVDLISTRFYTAPDETKPESTRHDGTETTTPAATSSDYVPWPEDDDERQPPPEPNVFGIVVDQEGRPVEGALVTAVHVVPYLATPVDVDSLGDRFDFGPEPDAEDEPDGQARDPEEDAGPGGSGFDPDEPDDAGFLPGDEADRPGPASFATGAGTESLADYFEEDKAGPAWGRFPECHTDESGRFALHVCDELWFELFASKQGFFSPFRVFREPQDGIRLVLYGPGSIVGRVVDADTGEPVQRFTATLSPNTSGWGSYRDSEDELSRKWRLSVENAGGRFLFNDVAKRFPDMEGRSYQMDVEADGYVPANETIWPVGGIETRATVRLRRSAQLTGQVVWASSGEPVQGVWIETRHRALASYRTFWEWDSPEGCQVDEDGRFELQCLSAGWTTIAVDADNPNLGWLSESLGTLHTQEVTLPPSETTHVVLRLPDTLASVSGRVVHENTGEPIAGVEVSLTDSSSHGFGPGGLEPADQVTTTTGNDGAFRFAEVQPGNYYLTAVRESHHAVERHRLRLKRGDSLQGLIVQLGKLGALEGRVTDASGRPVQATVYCGGIREECPAGGSWQSASTDDEGRFRLENTLAGHSTVTCSAREGEYREERLVEIEANRVTHVDFTVDNTNTVGGTVTIEGVPIEGVEVHLMPDLLATDVTAGFAGGPGDFDEETNPDGCFRIRGVVPGEYTLFCTMEGRAASRHSPFTMPVHVEASDVEVDVQLPTGMVAGRVWDAATLEPVRDALVSINRRRGTGDPAVDVGGLGTLSTAGIDPFTGEYAFAPVADGSYVISAFVDRYGAAAVEVEVVDGKQVGAGDIVLSSGYAVRCTVVTAQTTAPPMGVFVTAYDTAGRRLGMSWGVSACSENEEAFVGYFPPGDYVFEAQSSGTGWQRVGLTVTQNGENLVRFQLPRGSMLVVEACDPRGEPVHGALASVKDADGITRPLRRGGYEEGWALSVLKASDGHGLARIEHLVPGTYTLTVRAAGYRPAEQQVEVLDADETRVKIVLERVPDE
jgi:hypothetical protein